MNINFEFITKKNNIINLPFFVYRKENIKFNKINKINFLIKSYLITYFFKKFNGKTFCFFLNFFYGKDGIIKYDRSNSFYIKKTKNREIFFPNKYRLSGSMVNHDYELENLLQSYCINNFEISKDDLVVDCGANNGMFYIALKKFVSEFKYVGFEPDDVSFKCLNLNLSDDKNTTLYDVALSNNNQEKDLYISSDFGDTSLEKFQSENIKVVKTEKLDNYELNKIHLLKIDAEGHELNVLKGAKSTLQNTRFICIDMGAEKGYENTNTVSEVINFLLMNNFELLNFNENRVTGLFLNKNYS